MLHVNYNAAHSQNALTRAARGSNGQDVILRVLAIGEDGKEHVDLLHTLARGSSSLFSSNHALPLLEVIELDDITVGVFPKVSYSCSDVYGSWAQSSVGDILEVVAQCLEVRVPSTRAFSRCESRLTLTTSGSRLLACLRDCAQSKQFYALILSFSYLSDTRMRSRITSLSSGCQSRSVPTMSQLLPGRVCI